MAGHHATGIMLADDTMSVNSFGLLKVQKKQKPDTSKPQGSPRNHINLPDLASANKKKETEPLSGTKFIPGTQ